MWRLVFDIIRFKKFALDLLREPRTSSDESYLTSEDLETIGHYLKRQGYSDTFRDNYLIPITASMWTASSNKSALDFPVVTLVRAMYVAWLCLAKLQH